MSKQTYVLSVSPTHLLLEVRLEVSSEAGNLSLYNDT